MTYRISGTCGRGHWRTLFYETVKNVFLGNVELTHGVIILNYYNSMVNCNKMPGKMKIMYLNFDKLTLSHFFLMVFDSKFKINLYHETFPDTLKKYTRFPILLFFSVLVTYVSIERIYAATFAAALFPFITLLQSLTRFLFKRFIWIVL